MAKSETQFVCQQCGAAHSKWAGRCDACGGWNTLVEEAVATGPANSLAKSGGGKGIGKSRGRRLEFTGLQGNSREIRAASPASPSSTASAAAAWCRAPPCSSAAIPASANRRCCSRSLAALAAGKRGKTIAAPISPAKKSLDQVRLRAARAWASPRAGASSPPRPASAISSTALESRRRAEHRGDRFDPDHVSRYARQRARLGQPGARLRAGADPPRQEARLPRHPGRPRHQGRR